MKIVLLTIALLGFAFLGMAINIVFRKKEFPDTHVGHNKEMKKRGIVCAKTMHRMEQNKGKQTDRFRNLSLVKK